MIILYMYIVSRDARESVVIKSKEVSQLHHKETELCEGRSYYYRRRTYSERDY